MSGQQVIGCGVLSLILTREGADGEYLNVRIMLGKPTGDPNVDVSASVLTDVLVKALAELGIEGER